MKSSRTKAKSNRQGSLLWDADLPLRLLYEQRAQACKKLRFGKGLFQDSCDLQPRR